MPYENAVKTCIFARLVVVEIVGGRIEVESSGGITFDTIRSYAECGVDYVSVGALTHSVKSLDMSFKAAGSDKLIIK